MAKVTAITSKTAGNKLSGTNKKNQQLSSEDSSDDEDIPIKDTKIILKSPTKKPLKVLLFYSFTSFFILICRIRVHLLRIVLMTMFQLKIRRPF